MRRGSLRWKSHERRGIFRFEGEGLAAKLVRCDSRLDRLPIQQVFYIKLSMLFRVVFVNM